MLKAPDGEVGDVLKEPEVGVDVLETPDGGDVLGGEIFLLHRDILLDPRLVQSLSRANGGLRIACRPPCMCMSMCLCR